MTNTQQTTRAKFDAFIAEVRQCVAGQRGYVMCSIKRAAEMGLQHSSLVVAAEVLGLEVQRHGKYGYCASRKVAA